MTPPAAQSGLTYVEVLIAAALLAIVLVPALSALQTSMLATDISGSLADQHYAAQSKMEEMLAEPHGTLITAAGAAGNYKTPSSYSDASGSPDRRVVYLARYDADDADGDGNAFTVPDPNLDGDNDPFTGYLGLLWVRVEIEGSVTSLETLTAP